MAPVHSRRPLAAALLLAVPTLAAADARQEHPNVRGSSPQAEVHRITDRGIAVTLRSAPQPLRDGDSLRVSFSLEDEATRAPLTGARPAAWLAERPAHSVTSPHGCVAQAARFLGGTLADRAAVDFNVYDVLALNDDASISVVDPRFSFGGSHLLASVRLPGRGQDWALSADGDTLFVSIPAAGVVTVVDTRSWTVRSNIAVAGRPARVALQPDGAQLWVAGDAALAVIDTATLTVNALPGGPAALLAFSDDSRTAFVSGRTRALRVVDTRTFAARSVTLAFVPGSLAWSSAAQLAYVGDPQGGVVAAVQPRSGQVAGDVRVQAGFTQLRFAPGGRYGFLPNPTGHVVQVIDAASNQVVHTADVPAAPDQVTFTDRLAFIRRHESDAVMMIPLQRLGDAPGVGVADFTGGQHALGAGKYPALADSIVETPDGPGVLVANPADGAIYYYREGMAAPMGSFSNYGREPRAVLVLDRSLRERPGGTYATTTPAVEAGAYDVVFFLDSPRVTACFPLEVAERPETRSRRQDASVVTLVDALPKTRAGVPARIRVRIEDARTHQTRAADDVAALVMQAPGIWQGRAPVARDADGSHSVAVTPPTAGTYYVWFVSAVAGLPINNPHFITFEVD